MEQTFRKCIDGEWRGVDTMSKLLCKECESKPAVIRGIKVFDCKLCGKQGTNYSDGVAVCKQCCESLGFCARCGETIIEKDETDTGYIDSNREAIRIGDTVEFVFRRIMVLYNIMRNIDVTIIAKIEGTCDEPVVVEYTEGLVNKIGELGITMQVVKSAEVVIQGERDTGLIKAADRLLLDLYSSCKTCSHIACTGEQEPCKSCDRYCNHELSK